MGVQTLDGYLSDLRDALQRQDLSLQKAAGFVNASLREFGYAFKFAELESTGTFTTVAGTASYSPPADFRMLRESGMQKTAPTNRIGKLKKETRDQYLRRLADTSDATLRNEPRWYHRYGRLFFLRPTPDDTVTTITFDYWKTITPLASGSDVSPFSDDWDDVVFTGALYRGFRNQGEHDRYINIRNDFLALVRSRSLEEDVEEIVQGGLEIVDSPQALERDDYLE